MYHILYAHVKSREISTSILFVIKNLQKYTDVDKFTKLILNLLIHIKAKLKSDNYVHVIM